MTFSGCRVTYGDKILFEPSWGMYDMAVGEEIVSAFSGPADALAYGLIYPAPKEKTHKFSHSEKAKHLHSLYQQVRDMRESQGPFNKIPLIWDSLVKDYPYDWLLPMEILEISSEKNSPGSLAAIIREYLQKMKERIPSLARLIDNGFLLIS
jgi:phenylalanine-4-hydroxylase